MQDTLAAVSEVCRWLHTSDARIGYSGNKDRRAVTSQLCTVYRVRYSEPSSTCDYVYCGNSECLLQAGFGVVCAVVT